MSPWQLAIVVVVTVLITRWMVRRHDRQLEAIDGLKRTPPPAWSVFCVCGHQQLHHDSRGCTIGLDERRDECTCMRFEPRDGLVLPSWPVEGPPVVTRHELAPVHGDCEHKRQSAGVNGVRCDDCGDRLGSVVNVNKGSGPPAWVRVPCEHPTWSTTRHGARCVDCGHQVLGQAAHEAARAGFRPRGV